jgi:hypothetical protein
MQKAIAFCAAAIAAALLFTGATSAAELGAEPAQYAGHAYVNLSTGNVTWGSPEASPAAVGTDIYSNITSAANAAISSTSLTSVWGDRVTTVGVGVLAENDFTIYNSSSSLGPLLTANVTVNFYNFATNGYLGGYATAINFGAGLPVGFYSTVTVTNIDPLAINLNVNDIVVTQTITSKTGTANRLGVASLDPVTLGLSLNTMYINSSTIGPSGYYTLGAGINANPGYRINALQAVPTEATTWGKVKSLYR